MKRKPKIHIVSLGCPKNLVDSEKMLALLAEGGCSVAAPPDGADVVLVNTCGFLRAARKESLAMLNQAIELKKAGKVGAVIAAGCLASRDGDKLFAQAAGLDAVVNLANREKVMDVVNALMSTRPRTTAGCSNADENIWPVGDSDTGRFRLTPRHTAYLRIAEGCCRRCTFCTIPAIRGPYRSKPSQQVLAEAKELVADGAVELNIIAQDTTNYGKDLVGGKWNIARLLRQIDRTSGAKWIRLLYTYPHLFDDELIDTLATGKHIVPYVDMPLQHISDGVLRRMGRIGRRAEIEKILRKLRRRVPDIVIRTTLIVGFPGETAIQFKELLDFVRVFKFDALGVFEYSPEPGTPAAKLDGKIPAAVKKDRARQIMLAQQKIVLAANKRRLGQRTRILVDGADSQGRSIGRHAGQAPDIDGVCYLNGQHRPGSFVNARIVGWDGYDLLAE